MYVDLYVVEAQYAHAKRKRIIPVRMQANYRPDSGWLAAVCLNNLHYDFSDCSTDQHKFNDQINQLLAELNQLGVRKTANTGLYNLVGWLGLVT